MLIVSAIHLPPSLRNQILCRFLEYRSRGVRFTKAVFYTKVLINGSFRRFWIMHRGVGLKRFDCMHAKLLYHTQSMLLVTYIFVTWSLHAERHVIVIYWIIWILQCQVTQRRLDKPTTSQERFLWLYQFKEDGHREHFGDAFVY